MLWSLSMSLFYCQDTERGLRLLNEWHLKEEFISVSTLRVLSAILCLNDIIKYVKDKLEMKSEHNVVFSKRKSAIANLLVDKNMVHLHSPSRTFIVQNQKNLDSCSCILGSKCVHILPAQFAKEGKPLRIKKPSFSLSDLSRKIRADKKSGV